MEKLQNPKLRAEVETMLPRIINDVEKGVSTLPLSGKGQKIIPNFIAAARNGGLKGVEDAVAKGLLPTAVLGAVLIAHDQVPQSPDEQQGLY